MRRFTKLLAIKFSSPQLPRNNKLSIASCKTSSYSLISSVKYNFSDLPKHDVLSMPALSPTMSEGKIVKWNKNVGDKVEEGDIICEVETDKATVGFEATSSGYLAQKRETDGAVPVGEPLIVVVQKKDLVAQFADFKFDGKKSEKQGNKPEEKKETQPKQENKSEPKQTQQSESSSQSYPKHAELRMPALSPTMAEGKIVKWNIKEGESFSEGDALAEIETDKATVTFEATETGVLAKILAKEGSQLKVGDSLAVSVKNKQDVSKFADYTSGSSSANKKEEGSKSSEKQETDKKSENKEPQQKQEKPQQSSGDGNRIFASPAAKRLAGEKGINLSDIGSGSGPEGRIISQDVESFTPKAKSQESQESVSKSTSTQAESSSQSSAPKQKPQKVEIPENPYQEITLSNMRKTIASRLTESKTTIPHYYINLKVEMDRVNALRAELNSNEKENGVKISVNDIIVKAMALALRDYPTVNAQWHGSSVRQFKYSDISVAVATEGGLITPIVYRADTLGLIDIAKRTKDIAKRAREGKLDPREYIGGTTTISNLGMFGINSVTSVINPPQSTILGVGKTEKQVLFDEKSENPEKPYRIAEVMELVVSADHRVVDGALAAQWVTRIKKYLEHPTSMLL